MTEVQQEPVVLPRGGEALQRLLDCDDVHTILDVGSGDGVLAGLMRQSGREVTTLSLVPPADVVCDFLSWTDTRVFDAVWACHVLEHQVDPGAFLRECRRRLRPGGLLAVTVPPAKEQLVGGHVTLWNAGLLLYQLVLAGFDCRGARVGTYGYNISVLVRRTDAALPPLEQDYGDIERLAQYFPLAVKHGQDGRLSDVGWGAQVSRPERVAILGLGPSLEEFVKFTKRAGGRGVHYDEVWGINAIGDVIACDRVFHMDDVRIQEIRAAANPTSNIAAMLKWMKTHPGPIYTSRTHPDYPGLVEYPLAEVLNTGRHPYLNNTAAHAVAFAVHLGVKKIALYGVDFTYPNAHDAEKGRACVEFWLGIAAARGIKIAMPRVSSLMDACAPAAERLYGYDTLDVAVKCEVDGGPIAVAFTEKPGPLPTADEIEARYDHARHPNRIVDDAQGAAFAEEDAAFCAMRDDLAAEAVRHREAGRLEQAEKFEAYAKRIAGLIESEKE